MNKQFFKKKAVLILFSLFIATACSKDDVITPVDNEDTADPTDEETVESTDKYAKGLFVIKENNNIDFIPDNGSVEEGIFSKNNSGVKFHELEKIHEIIPHKTGYLMVSSLYISNDSDENKGIAYFMDKDFKLVKKENLTAGNSSKGKYTIIDSKIYYTTTISRTFFDSPTNRGYIIDVDTNTIKAFNTNVTQYLSDSKGNLYAITPVNELVLVDKNDLTNATAITQFSQWMDSKVVIDNNDVVWGMYKDVSGANIWDVIRDDIYRKINIVRYDLNTKKLTDNTVASESNLESILGLSYDKSKVYMALTNETDKNKSLYSLTFKDNLAQLTLKHKLDFNKLSKVNEYELYHLKDNGFWFNGGKRYGAGNNFLYYKLSKNGEPNDIQGEHIRVRTVIYNP